MLNNTFGIVVCGGQSRRMGIDKSMLTYYEKPQRYHLYELLQPFCDQVLISCNETQSHTIEPGYNILTDLPSFNNTGPMAGLLTAFTKFPKKNMLFIGCDYPFLTEVELQRFMNYIEGKNSAVAFCNNEDIYEPLLAWYPCILSAPLNIKFSEDQYSLQHFLKSVNGEKYYPENCISTTSIDSREQFIKALEEIKYEQPG